MTIGAGTLIGPYEILGRLGAGGMGEVYRARDPRLGRDVAIKALPAGFADDPDRLARFEREARILAALSHPNVAGILGLEEGAGQRYLVLELVEGETLAHRLAREPMPVPEAVELCRDIAAGVEAAHEAGIVHRDLKPGNVMISVAGAVKVLDFGLAKSGAAGAASGPPRSDPSASASPTFTTAATQAGLILGTAAYMSPEQARGRAVDKRTDVWSFGCVLYECLTGRQCFGGETVSDTIARILQGEPDWSALPAGTPSRLRALLRRALEKDVRRRLRDIGEARIELEELLATRSPSGTFPAAAAHPPADPAPAPGRRAFAWRRAWPLLATALAASVATWLVMPSRPAAPPRPVRFDVAAPPGAALRNDAVHQAVAPDGRTLALIAWDPEAAKPAIWLRPLEAAEARRLEGTEGAAHMFWSPDSRWLAYQTSEKMFKVSVDGGRPEFLADSPGGRGGAWSRDGVIVYAPRSYGGLSRISANGGQPAPLTTPESGSGESAHRFPQLLPDGEHVLFTSLPPRDGMHDLKVVSIAGGAVETVGRASSGALLAPSGHLVFQRNGLLLAQRFDVRTRRTVGEPVSLGIATASTRSSGAPLASVSADGTLAFMPFVRENNRLAVLDAAGRETREIPLAPGNNWGFRLSRDGRRAAGCRWLDAEDNELVVVSLESGLASRLRGGPGRSMLPVWSPDGRALAGCFQSGQGFQRIVVYPLEGGGEHRELLADDPVFKRVYSWSPDGKWIVIGRQVEATRVDLYLLPADGSGPPQPYLATPANEEVGQISPDGRWMAYESDEGGERNVYVRSFPSAGMAYPVSQVPTALEGWSATGALRFIEMDDTDTVQEADVLPGPDFRLGPARVVARLPRDVGFIDVAPDGREILAVIPPRDRVPPTVGVVLHWTELLRSKEPEPRR